MAVEREVLQHVQGGADVAAHRLAHIVRQGGADPQLLCYAHRLQALHQSALVRTGQHEYLRVLLELSEGRGELVVADADQGPGQSETAAAFGAFDFQRGLDNIQQEVEAVAPVYPVYLVQHDAGGPLVSQDGGVRCGPLDRVFDDLRRSRECIEMEYLASDSTAAT